jgi:hypothetical protein
MHCPYPEEICNECQKFGLLSTRCEMLLSQNRTFNPEDFSHRRTRSLQSFGSSGIEGNENSSNTQSPSALLQLLLFLLFIKIFNKK